MSKNLIPIIAKELGVEIGEEFKTASIAGRFKFNLDGLLAEHKEGRVPTWLTASPLVLKLLITGRCEIIKLPFEPQEGECYWTYNGNDFGIVEIDWTGFASEYCKKACGCIFRTEAEAIKARPAKYKELTGKEWQESEG